MLALYHKNSSLTYWFTQEEVINYNLYLKKRDSQFEIVSYLCSGIVLNK
jgi:hypothetical protein